MNKKINFPHGKKCNYLAWSQDPPGLEFEYCGGVDYSPVKIKICIVKKDCIFVIKMPYLRCAAVAFAWAARSPAAAQVLAAISIRWKRQAAAAWLSANWDLALRRLVPLEHLFVDWVSLTRDVTRRAETAKPYHPFSGPFILIKNLWLACSQPQYFPGCDPRASQ